jgi:molybdopterin-guanine dinucleotide biosynthesis protein A
MPTPGPDRQSPTTLCAAILAGGRASRYGGRPKGLLRLPDGVSIIERTIGVIQSAGIEEVLIVANDPSPYEALGHAIVRDRRPDRGPLAGIEAALHHCSERCDAVLVLPCDLPGMTAEVVAGVRDAAIERDSPAVVSETENGFWRPLCAVVRVDALPAVTAALDEGRNGVYALWREIGATSVRFDDARPFFSVNSPEDLERWLANEDAGDHR